MPWTNHCQLRESEREREGKGGRDGNERKRGEIGL